MTTDSFTATGTWTCPAGVYVAQVTCWGAGGGGGGGDTAGNNSGGGGAGGQCSIKNVPVAPGTVYTVTIGAAGIAGVLNTSGGVGGDSWFGTTGTVIAKGGAFGVTAGAGGTGSTTGGIGDTVFAGGNGGGTVAATSASGGGGGGGAGTTGNGGNGGAGQNNAASTGGTGTALSGGNGGICGNKSTGTAGSVYGGGGGGGGCFGGGKAGAAGAAGRLEVTYTPSFRPVMVTTIAKNTAVIKYGRIGRGSVDMDFGPPAVSSTPISDGDTGSGAEGTESVAVTLSDTDTGAGAEAETVAATLSAADTGSGVDTESLATLIVTPSLSVTAQARNTAQQRYSRTPRGRIYASAQPFTITDADTGAAADAESALVASLSDTDTAAGVDAGAVPPATLSSTDTGSGLDTESVAVMLVTNLLVLLQAKAQAQWYYRNAAHGRTNFVPLSPPLVISDADTATGTENGSIAANSADSDTGTAVDAESLATLVTTTSVYVGQAVNSALWYRKNASKGRTAFVPLVPQGVPQDSDSGSSAEASSITVTVSDADTGTGVETESVATPLVTPSLVLSQARNSAVWRYKNAAMGRSEFVPLAPPLAVSDGDTGAGAESGTVAASLTGSDTSSATEQTTILANTSGSDSSSSSSGESVAVDSGIHVGDGDTASGRDNFYPPDTTPPPPHPGRIWPSPVTRRPLRGR